MTQPRQSTPAYELYQCCQTLKRALLDMVRDIDAGRLEDDTLPRDHDFIRKQLGRREVIVGVMAEGKRTFIPRVRPEYVSGQWDGDGPTNPEGGAERVD